MLLIKRGVCHWNTFACRALERELAHRGWWPFSFELLAELDRVPAEYLDALLDRLYRALPGGEKIWKITRRDRFPEVDDALIDWIVRRPSRSSISIHDMGASNGITSLALFDKVKQFPNVKSVLASDYFDSLTLIEVDGIGWKGFYDTEGRCLQLVGRNFVFSAQQIAPLRYVGNRVLQHWILRYVEPKLRSARDEWLNLRRPPVNANVRQIQLFHPDCVRLSEREPRFHLGRDDVMACADRKWTVVRAMNILTSHHLPFDRLRSGLANIAQRVEHLGVLVLGRNIDEEDGRVCATMFEKHNNSWRIISRLNQGYEHEDLFTEALTEASTAAVA